MNITPPAPSTKIRFQDAVAVVRQNGQDIALGLDPASPTEWIHNNARPTSTKIAEAVSFGSHGAVAVLGGGDFQINQQGIAHLVRLDNGRPFHFEDAPSGVQLLSGESRLFELVDGTHHLRLQS